MQMLAAKQAIADKVQAQETAIDANNGSTTEEEAAKQQVQTKKRLLMQQ